MHRTCRRAFSDSTTHAPCCMPAQVAVACIEVASQAIAAMPLLLFWPLLPFIAFAGLIIYWVAVAAFLYSAGTIEPHQLTSNAQSTLTLSVRMGCTLLIPQVSSQSCGFACDCRALH